MIRFFLLFVCVIFLLSSCVSEYGVAHRSYPSTKLPVPYANGKDTSASYIGASYSGGSAALGFASTVAIRAAEDQHSSYQISAHYGHYSKNVYQAIGIMGYKGVYELQSFPMEEILGPLDFWGVAATYEVGLSFPSGDFNLRPIGAKLTGLLEPGEYADFRSTYLDRTINFVDYRNGNPDNFLYNISGVFGVSYHPGDWNYSFDMILGASDEDMAIGLNSYVSYKRLYLLMNFTTEHIKGRYALSAGLMYQL